MGVSLALLMLLLPVSSLTPSDVAGHSAHWLSSASAIRIAATVNDRGEVISDALRLRGGADAPPDAPPTERTYAMLKPDVASDVETVLKIKAMIVDAGFTIVREESALLTEQQCAQFYAEHAERSFFGELTSFMSSGPVLKLELEAPDAIKRWRALIGPTNSHKAREEAPATIRALFGKDGQENAAHGSDAPEAAAREILTEDFRFGGSLSPEKRGQDGFIKYMCSVRAALGDYQCVIYDLIETEGRDDARMTLKGIHLAPFF